MVVEYITKKLFCFWVINTSGKVAVGFPQAKCKDAIFKTLKNF
jgi:hypothetical protein